MKLPTIQTKNITLYLSAFFVSTYIALMIVQNVIEKMNLWIVSSIIIGFGVELSGITIMILYHQVENHNRRYSTDKNQLSKGWIVSAYALYLAIVLSANVLLEIPGNPDWLIARSIIVRGLLSILSISTAIAISINFLLETIIKQNKRKPRKMKPKQKEFIATCTNCGWSKNGYKSDRAVTNALNAHKCKTEKIK